MAAVDAQFIWVSEVLEDGHSTAPNFRRVTSHLFVHKIWCARQHCLLSHIQR